MTSFTWKRKISKPTVIPNSNVFNKSEDVEQYVDDWMKLLPSNKRLMLEDNISICRRLMEEGIFLAEKERYWEAILKFDKALEYDSNEARLYEMKAQALMELQELFPAIQSAEKAVKKNPLWSEAYQTLGRTQINYGEIEMAIKSFSRAFHLNPINREILEEDIKWARALLNKRNIENEKERPYAMKESEINGDVNYLFE